MGREKAEPVDKVAELREATRLANEVLKDLKAERLAFKELMESIRPDTLKFIETEITKELDSMTVAMKKGMDSSVDRVITRFEKLEDLLMGGGSPDRPPLEEIAQEYNDKKRAMKHVSPRSPRIL